MRSQRSSWWLFKRHAETEGRLDGEARIPDDKWRRRVPPALHAIRDQAEAVDANIGAEALDVNKVHEVRALAGHRDLASARRDIRFAQQNVEVERRRGAALEAKKQNPRHHVAAQFIYWMVLLVNIVVEFPLLSSALQVIGEPQWATWAMAAAIGGLLFLAAHAVGTELSKAHAEPTTRRTSFAHAAGITALAVGFVVTFGMLRATFLVQLQQQLGLGTKLSAASAYWPFVLMQGLVFAVACVAARHRREYLVSEERTIKCDIKIATRRRRAADRLLDAARERELAALKTIDTALSERDNELRKKVQEGLVQRFLHRALMWRYWAENLRKRKPPLPAAFDDLSVPEIEPGDWTRLDHGLDRLKIDQFTETPTTVDPVRRPPQTHRPRPRRRAVHTKRGESK